jgi:hypothetical protein
MTEKVLQFIINLIKYKQIQLRKKIKMTNNNIRRRSTLERFRRCLLRHEGALHSRCHVRCPLDSTRRGRVGVIRYDHIHYTRVKRKEKKKNTSASAVPCRPSPKLPARPRRRRLYPHPAPRPRTSGKKDFAPIRRALAPREPRPPPRGRHATPRPPKQLRSPSSSRPSPRPPPPIEPPSPSASRLRARLGGGREARSWAGVSAPQGPGRRDREKGPRLLAPRALDWVS